MSWSQKSQPNGPPPPPPLLSKTLNFPDSPDGRTASNNGHGTDDTLRVTQILEEQGIPCCLVGISALIFYGAARCRPDWEICVATDSVDKAKNLLQSEPYSENYCLVEPWPYPDASLIPTYNRFKSRGVNHYFLLVPSVDVHLECGADNIVRSKRGLPYPSLSAFIQSCLDRRSMVELVDVVDGTDIDEQWGETNLQLDGTNDVQWARDLNRRGEELDGGKYADKIIGVPDRPMSRRTMWQEAVRTKEKRLDWTKPKSVFVTQYRIVDDPNSWEVLSDMY